MDLTHIKLTDLRTAKVNVRKHGGKDIADLEPSIRALGLLQPLLVRLNGDGYEVVAGQRRFRALVKIAEDTDVEPVPCIVMGEGDDTRAIEASLAENVARLPMDEIDQYTAFAALAKQGLSVEDIAARFGVTDRLVRQRLAIANLLPPILTAYRRDEIDAQTMRLLTMASKAQQKAWLKKLRSEDEYAPVGRALKQWLLGGADVPTGNALFDLGSYEGELVRDLFDEDSYFADVECFWTAQNAAIATTKAAYLADGWCEVVVLDIGAYFARWDHAEASKADGGKVFIEVGHDGAVTFHEGFLSHREIRARERAESDEPSAPRPELTKAMQNYLDLHRHAAVRSALPSHPGIALRLAVAQIIAGSDLWSVRADPQTAKTDAIADSLAGNKAETAFARERAEVLALLGLGADDPAIVPRPGDWMVRRDLHVIFAKLLTLPDDDVSRILSFVVAETLPSGSALVEVLGQKLEVDLGAVWSSDDTFFDLLRDKPVINAMLAEVGGQAAADANVTATAKVQKKIIRDCLNGARPGAKDWRPRYAIFPMGTYTDRGGLDAFDNWNAVAKHYR